MLALIDKGEAFEAHPAFWAPFVLVGRSRNICVGSWDGVMLVIAMGIGLFALPLGLGL
jgi:hypothetical protein